MPPGQGVLPAAGPIGRVISTDGTSIQPRQGRRPEADANALIMLRRVVFLGRDGAIDKRGARSLLRWAAEQDHGQDAELLRMAAARRERALAALRARGRSHARWLVSAEWRLAVGLGNRDNPHEIGLALHGTYGWPVIPGSSLKGMTAAWAEGGDRAGEPKADADRLDQIFGLPRPGRTPPPRLGVRARQGGVRFLDALPAGEPVQVGVDVLTPHVQPYYADTEHATPPAEYHNPVPFEFLVISGGAFAVDIVGPKGDVEPAARWCGEAFEELGIGAKTAAGYGYVSARRSEGSA